MATAKVYDLYAPVLNYKKPIGTLNRPCVSASWVPVEHRRRLSAYDILAAYYYCYSRDYRYSPESGDAGNNDIIKEYGTPAWLCDKIKNKLLGGAVSINIPVPKSLGNANSLKRMIDATEDAKEKASIQERLDSVIAVKNILAQREAKLQDWFSDANVYTKIDENETTASHLGDMIYLLTWDAASGEPKVETFDPGFCFYDQDCDEVSIDDKSSVVISRLCVAWEDVQDYEKNTRKIYRRVFELRKGTGSNRCFMHEANFIYEGELDVNIWDFDDSSIEDGVSVAWVDLGIDFIPAVWVPNITVQGETCGISNIHRLLPLFDSIMNNDTDLSKNGEKLGGASVIVSGKDMKPRKDAVNGGNAPVSFEPNSLYFTGEGGSAELLDTSNMQEALLKTGTRLEEELIELTEITPVAAGRIKPGDQIPSGVALTIMLQPLLDKVGNMRQQRQQFYATLFYYVQRMFQEFGTPDEKALFSGVLYDVRLQFGDIIPSDQKTKAEYYNSLKGTLDDQTILEMMKEDGFSFDIETVLQRKAEQAEKMNQAQANSFDIQRFMDTGNTDTGSDDSDVSKTEPAITSAAPAQTSLNGAQITASVEVVQAVVNKRMPDVAGIELLVAVGIPRENAISVIAAATKMKPLPEAPANDGGAV